MQNQKRGGACQHAPYGSMEPFALYLSFAPLAVYLLRLALIHSLRRPVVLSGTRERTSLGLALAGFVAVGPMQLFMPDDAATYFGPYVWLLLATFYGLCLSLANLLARPRLGVYNLSADELQPLVAEVAAGLDPQATWLAERLSLPQLGVHLTLEEFRPLRHVSLVATGQLQTYANWRRLEQALRDRLAAVEVRPGMRGFVLLAVGLLLVAAALQSALGDPQAIVDGLRDLLQL
jgi:hypothetical protein